MATISSSSTVPRTCGLLLVVVVLVLAGAAASVGAQAADDAVADEEARSFSGLLKASKAALKVAEFFKNIAEEFYKKSKEDKEERGGGGVASKGRVVNPSGAVRVVNTGGSKDFSVLVVDVTSAVTWTSQCGGGQRRVQCGDPLCKRYGGDQQANCGSAGAGAAQACSAGKDALLQGNISLSTSGGQRVFSAEDTVYTCRPGENSGEYAVLGLARGSVLANSSKTFSYLVDSNLRSFVWLGDDAAARAPATGDGRKSTTQLISVVDSPNMDPSFYYVNIIGIKVGDGRVSGKNAATTAILTTTMPFTFLNQALFDDLKQELRTTAAASDGDSDLDASFEQLCYPKETKLPEITLAFAGKDAAMKLEPEHYSYKKSNGVVCLSILPSPWSSGVSVIIGSMLQAGRRMTYNLDDNTLTFDLQASSGSKTSSSPSSSSLSRSSAVAVAPVFIMISSTWLSLLLAMMM